MASSLSESPTEWICFSQRHVAAARLLLERLEKEDEDGGHADALSSSGTHQAVALASSDDIAAAIAVCLSSTDVKDRDLAKHCASNLLSASSSFRIRLTDALLSFVLSGQTQRLTPMHNYADLLPVRAAALDVFSSSGSPVANAALENWLEAILEIASSTKSVDDVIERALVTVLEHSTFDAGLNWQTCRNIAYALASRASASQPSNPVSEGSNPSQETLCRKRKVACKLASFYLSQYTKTTPHEPTESRVGGHALSPRPSSVDAAVAPSQQQSGHELARNTGLKEVNIMDCKDWQAVGEIVDLFAQSLPDELAKQALDCRARAVDSGMDRAEWSNRMQAVALHYFVRDRREKVRLEALGHLRNFLFDRHGFDRNVIVTDILGQLTPHGGERADEPLIVVRSLVDLYADVLCSTEVPLDARALKIVFAFLKDAAHGQRAGAEEAIAAVHAIRSIIQARLNGKSSWIARKLICALYSTFLNSPYCRAAREAAYTLNMIAVSQKGDVVLPGPYAPVEEGDENAYKCEIVRSPERNGSDVPVEGAKRCFHSLSEFKYGEDIEPQGTVNQVASSSASGYVQRASMKLEPRVPMKGVEMTCSALKVRAVDLIDRNIACKELSMEDPNEEIGDDSSGNQCFFAPEYMIHALLGALLSVSTRHINADIAIARALRHAVMEICAREAGLCGNIASQLVNVLTGGAESGSLSSKIQMNATLSCILASAICTVATHVRCPHAPDFWRALVPSEFCKYSADALYQAGEGAVLQSDKPSTDQLSVLATLCRQAVCSQRNTRKTVKVLLEASGQSVVATATQPLPDDLDFASLETMQMLLSLDENCAIADMSVNTVVDGVVLGSSSMGLECDVKERFSVAVGNRRLRWIDLSIGLFCCALDKASAKERVAIESRLRPLSENGNILASLLLEYCICYVSSVRPVMRYIDYRPGDHTCAVRTKGLPYLVTLRRLPSGDLLVCQRRATSASCHRVADLSWPHTQPVASQGSLLPDSGNDGSSARLLEERDEKIRRNVTRNTTTACSAATTPETRDLLHSEPSGYRESQGAGSTGWSTCGLVECLGGGGANEVVELDGDIRFTIDVIDHTLPSALHRIGVVLVPENVYEASDILGCQWNGRYWYSFLKDLGSFVPLAVDLGAPRKTGEGEMSRDAILTSAPYTGGLNAEQDGSHFLSYTERARQVVFQVPSMIPDGRNAVSRRLSNLLNCNVLIAWNASGRRFDPATFDTQFASVYIIISPTTFDMPKPVESSDLFRVRVISDRMALRFGPLRPNMDGYLIPWDKLSNLVRLTAIHADTAVHAAGDKQVQSGVRCEDRAKAILRLLKSSSPPARLS